MPTIPFPDAFLPCNEVGVFDPFGQHVVKVSNVKVETDDQHVFNLLGSALTVSSVEFEQYIFSPATAPKHGFFIDNETGRIGYSYIDADNNPQFSVVAGNTSSGTNNYNQLINKPQINGETIQGDMSVADVFTAVEPLALQSSTIRYLINAGYLTARFASEQSISVNTYNNISKQITKIQDLQPFLYAVLSFGVDDVPQDVSGNTYELQFVDYGQIHRFIFDFAANKLIVKSWNITNLKADPVEQVIYDRTNNIKQEFIFSNPAYLTYIDTNIYTLLQDVDFLINVTVSKRITPPIITNEQFRWTDSVSGVYSFVVQNGIPIYYAISDNEDTNVASLTELIPETAPNALNYHEITFTAANKVIVIGLDSQDLIQGTLIKIINLDYERALNTHSGGSVDAYTKAESDDKFIDNDELDAEILYSNSNPSLITVGALTAGTTFSNYSFKNFMDDAFYPSLNPNVTFSASPIFGLKERGVSVGPITLSTTFNKTTNNISSVIWRQNGTQISAGTITNPTGQTLIYNDGTLNGLTDTTFLTRVTDTEGLFTERSGSFTFTNPIYIGSVTSSTPTEAMIKGMTKRINANHTQQVFTYTITQEYFCLWVPVTYGACTSILDPSGFQNIDAFNQTTLSITNVIGEAVPGNLYVLKQPTSQSNFTVTYRF